LIFLLAVPIITIAFKLFLGPGESWSHLVENVLLEYSLHTIILSMGCIILTTILGVSSAWIVSRYEIPKSKYLEWMLILPLAIPSYITAYAYAGIFDYGGLLSQVLGLVNFKVDIMNIYGLIFVLSVSLFPYVYLSTRAVFLFQSNRLIEASKLLGASEIKTFFRIVIPMSRPAIIGGLFLVVMEVLNDYGAAKYYGISTFTTGIFRSWFSLAEPSTAIYLSSLLLLLVFSLMFLERKQRGNKSYSNQLVDKVRLPKIQVSRPKLLMVSFIVLIPIILGFIIPMIQLLMWGFLTYSDVFSSSFFTIAIQSIGIAMITGFTTLFFALLILYFPQWNRLTLLKKSSKIAIIGYAIPGAIIAIGVMVPTLAIDKWMIKVANELFNLDLGLVLNGTILILIYAYVIRFMAVAFNPLEASQLKISKQLSESSQLLGKGRIHTFFKVDYPLLKTSMLSAFILVFVDIMKELPLTLILKPYNVNTLAVKAYEYASDELILESSIPSLCIILSGMIPILLLNKLILK